MDNSNHPRDVIANLANYVGKIVRYEYGDVVVQGLLNSVVISTDSGRMLHNTIPLLRAVLTIVNYDVWIDYPDTKEGARVTLVTGDD